MDIRCLCRQERPEEKSKEGEAIVSEIRHDLTRTEIREIYHRPLLDLIFQAASVHRNYFDPSEVQVSNLVSVKTGGCSEDCAYCPQAARYNTGLKRQGLMDVEDVLERARKARDAGCSRICLGAAWREVRDNKQFDQVLEMVREINAIGLEVCCTLGMLTEEQAHRLKEAGLYAYNHNIDTSEEHYREIISTRTYKDRLETLKHIRSAKLTACSGGIIGLGESEEDRIGMLLTLNHLDPHPESVPINTLVAVPGTPLGDREPVVIWDLVRMIAAARITLPGSYIRLSAGRKGRSIQDQALCFLAGANSIFVGEKLLTTPLPDIDSDFSMLNLLGMKAAKARGNGQEYACH